MNQELSAFYWSLLTPERKERILSVLSERTRFLTVILEDLYDPHNASAVLRTCDAVGVQDVHIIEGRNSFKVGTGVSMGSDKWLTLHRYRTPGVNNTEGCIRTLKEQGYRVLVTTPHEKAQFLPDLSMDQKTALLFGSEKLGASPEAMALADGALKIPMVGFSESFNISVSAALCLYDLSQKMRNSDVPWRLSTTEVESLRALWSEKSINQVDKIKRSFNEINVNRSSPN